MRRTRLFAELVGYLFLWILIDILYNPAFYLFAGGIERSEENRRNLAYRR